ncbi:uncharacterized protein HHUB_1103 [Halobacterium hubeiense]|uniref:Uncharacterized protein n=1 Tax=Halobacterium hubeiense TaxID=1407499 RepID=A0A0U5GZG8_9EURY|nr:uncharacterized protein HHUB_1103 [Halobacterium hubeiense]
MRSLASGTDIAVVAPPRESVTVWVSCASVMVCEHRASSVLTSSHP